MKTRRTELEMAVWKGKRFYYDGVDVWTYVDGKRNIIYKLKD